MSASLIEHHIKCLALNANRSFPSQIEDMKNLIKAWRREQHGGRHLCVVGSDVGGRTAVRGDDVRDHRGE